MKALKVNIHATEPYWMKKTASILTAIHPQSTVTIITATVTYQHPTWAAGVTVH
jgi:hypothetical protein